MNKHIAERWVQALRSGQYKQGQGELHPDPESYCCLGVLCDLYRVEQGKGEWVAKPNGQELGMFRAPNEDITEIETAVLPEVVKDWAGIQDFAGEIAGTSDSLAGLNDEGMGFPELADLIEKNWEVL